MKFISLCLMFLSLSAFSQIQEIEPELKECSDQMNLISFVQAPISKYSKTVAGDINIFGLAAPFGDPALWSLLYSVAITFPITNSDGLPDVACFLLEKASLTTGAKVKSLSYDAKKGRLISLEISVATYDNQTTLIGSKTKSIKVRVNKAEKKVTLD